MKVLFPILGGSPRSGDQAVAAGIIEVFDKDTMVGVAYNWKEEDGKVYVDSGFKGEENDWCEVTETDGMLDFLTYKLVREQSGRKRSSVGRAFVSVLAAFICL